MATKLIEQGLHDYRTVDQRNIKKNLEAFMEQEEVEALNVDGEDMLTAYRSVLPEVKRSPLESTGFEGVRGKYMKRLHESNITPAEFMKEQATEA